MKTFNEWLHSFEPIPQCEYVWDHVPTWQELRDLHDPGGKKHNLTLICTKCENKQTCRCMAPKIELKGICPDCVD